MTSAWRSRPQVLAVSACCAAILIGFGAFATAQVPSGVEQQQLAVLRQQVSLLEKRVTELERTKGSATKVDEPAQAAKDSAGTKTLEQRLAALEQAQATKSTALGLDKATIVTAPFVVIDRGGKVVMRVQGDPIPNAASRGVYVYGTGSDTPVAHLGLTDDGAGRAYVTDGKARRPLVQIVAGGGSTPAVLVVRGEGKGYNSIEQQGLMIRNDEGQAIGSITSQSGTGYLALSDSSGNTMMDAGTLKSQKGYVRVNPYRASTSPQGDPSVLMGGKK